MASPVRIDVIHGFAEDKPSINNLRQGLNGMGDGYNINFHSTRTLDRGDGYVNKMRSMIGIHVRSLLAFQEIISSSDLIIIHKFITPLDNALIERLFLKHENVIYTVYDAEYVYNPKKTKYLFENADLIHVISHAIAAYAREYSDDVTLIPPSVNTNFFTQLSGKEIENIQYSNIDDGFTIGWIGNASNHINNLRYVIQILEELDNDMDITFRLLCGGEIGDELYEEISSSQFNTDIIEWVPWSDVPKVINTFDVGLAPLKDTAFNRGRSSEKIREYMACGCPVIASNIGENPYLVPESAGFLVNSESEWADAIFTLMEEPEMCSNMGSNARKHVEENYSISVIADKLEDEITTILLD